MIQNDDRNKSYSCSYVPTSEGELRVIIKYAGKEIQNSPYIVKVEGAPGDPSKVTVAGPGIEEKGKNNVGRRTYFNAFTKGLSAQ